MDTDGDGVADAQSLVLDNLNYPFGLAFRHDTMYFAEQTAVSRLDPGAPAPVTVVAGFPSGGHVSRTIAFGPDNRLYVAMGSTCNMCDDPPPRSAVTSYDLDGSNPHTFATGLRNAVGLAFNPTTGELWANNNDRDGLGDDIPPEHLNIVRDGRWYGYPQCSLPGQPNPEYDGADCSGVEPPALTFEAHSAPLGLAFYAGAMFPADYQGDAFMTYHGSWDRSVPTGAKVVRVHVQNGRPTTIDDFVTGWQLDDGSRWGRPVGLLVMPDGALLVSDDGGGRIWRVSYGTGGGTESGNLAVSATTSGTSQPAGYTVVVDDNFSQPLDANGSVTFTDTFTDLTAGSHSVALSDVAGNCTVDGDNPQTVTVPAGGTATTAFAVTCVTPTGNLRVSTRTSGSSLDPDGYTVTLDGGSPRAVGINASVTYTNLAAGSHQIALSGVAANCTVSGNNPRTVTVPAGGTATPRFSVSCVTPPGTLTVSTSTTGSSLDPDGYTVTVDGGSPQPIGTNASVNYANLPAGDHAVALADVAPNCTVTGANPETVTVPAGGTATAAFSVSCVTQSGNLTVLTSTSGSSLDPDGYTLALDGGSPQPIGINASVSYTDLPAGSHTIALSGVAPNCTVSGTNPRTVTVPAGGSVTRRFTVSCVDPPGDLTVSTSTTGESLDPDGYTVTVDGGSPQTIGINASVSYTSLAAGDHAVALADVAANCTVSGANPQTVTVLSGGTVAASFATTCTTPAPPNQPPTVDAGPDQTVAVGMMYTLSGASFSDPDDAGPWTYSIDWGDQSFTTRTTSSQGALSGSHNYVMPGSYRITLTVTDPHGAAGSGSKVLTVGGVSGLH